MSYKSDILIVTVTEVESRAVINVFQEANGVDPKHIPIGDRVYIDLGKINDAHVFLAVSGMGSGGVDGSQEDVRKGIEALSPSAVIMVGIAFGINEQKQDIGDVLVSEQLILYDLQHVGEDKKGNLEIIPRGDKPHASPELINRLKMANLGKNESMAKIRYGLILSGNKLVDNIDFRNQLLKFEPEAIGGEMEGAGLYVACQNNKVNWILVKAICDWADGQKAKDKDARQQLAAQNAAAFVLHALQQVPLKSNRAPSPQMARRPKRSMPVEPHKPVYSSLPSQPNFFGREKELGLIIEAISPEARTWGALIDGPGGIGKTALAIRAGHIAPNADFDRKIFLSAKVRELTWEGEQNLEDFMLPNYMALLTQLARELGEENIAMIEPKERVNAVRRTLSNMRALIIIDNIETFKENERIRLYQFLSRLPVTCKAIVTSRRRTDIDARVLRLDRLERKDALDLMAEQEKDNRYLQEATDQERIDLYEITNGNGLLIKWTIWQLGREGSHCRTIPEACAFLKTAPKGNDPLEYIFGDLLDTFTASETAVLAALAHFTHPAKTKWIANVAEIAEPSAVTALEDLTDRALLISNLESQEFILPPLAGTFLRRMRPESIALAGDRLIDHAYAFILENGYIEYDRFPTLEAEWPTIAAALPLFLQGENDRLQEVCNALEIFLSFSGRWDESLTLSYQAEKKAVDAGDYYNAGMRAQHGGWIYILRGQAPEVLACAERCTTYWENIPQEIMLDKFGPVHIRGIGHQLEKNYPAAMEDFKTALSLAQAINPESESVGIVLNDIADTERKQGNYDPAERGYNEALRIAKKTNDLDGLATYTSNLAELAINRENWAVAEPLAKEALDLTEQLGRQELIGWTCWEVAETLVRQGKPQKGLPYARRAVKILSQLGISRNLEKAQGTLKECGG